MILLGNLLSLLASTCSVISTRAKNCRNTLLIQAVDSILFALSNLALGGYSGVVINTCGAIRSTLCAFFKLNRFVKTAIVIITIGLCIEFMDKAWYGILPILASTIYTIATVTTDDIKRLKTILVLNNTLWMIYQLIISDIVGVIFNIIAIISCIQTLIKSQGVYKNDL